MAYQTDVYDQTPAAGFETITVSTVSIGCTAASLLTQNVKAPTMDGQSFIENRRVDFAMFTIEAQPLRVRFDGTAPTSGVGHLYAAGDSFVVRGFQNLSNVKMIRSGGTDATVSVTYYRRG